MGSQLIPYRTWKQFNTVPSLISVSLICWEICGGLKCSSYGKFLIHSYTLFLKLVGVNSPVAVAVCDFPSGHTEPMVKMGEQLNLLSE